MSCVHVFMHVCMYPCIHKWKSEISCWDRLCYWTWSLLCPLDLPFKEIQGLLASVPSAGLLVHAAALSFYMNSERQKEVFKFVYQSLHYSENHIPNLFGDFQKSCSRKLLFSSSLCHTSYFFFDCHKNLRQPGFSIWSFTTLISIYFSSDHNLM